MILARYWDEFPTSTTDVSTGVTTTVTEAAKMQFTDNFALKLTGTLHIATAGDYVFKGTCDDGIRVWIDGEEVLVIDGAGTDVSSLRMLAAGTHDFRMDAIEYGDIYIYIYVIYMLLYILIME